MAVGTAGPRPAGSLLHAYDMRAVPGTVTEPRRHAEHGSWPPVPTTGARPRDGQVNGYNGHDLLSERGSGLGGVTGGLRWVRWCRALVQGPSQLPSASPSLQAPFLPQLSLFFFPSYVWESIQGCLWAGTVLARDYRVWKLFCSGACHQPGFLKEIYRRVKDPRPSLEVVREPWQQQRPLPGRQEGKWHSVGTCWAHLLPHRRPEPENSEVQPCYLPSNERP